mmetsp:Transcript_27869/g.86796  ORF Transcript_27869/g.86796 Transcript_27869/m.86796 type:complete len:237 (-) Transcript_27869:97-807(-)
MSGASSSMAAPIPVARTQDTHGLALGERFLHVGGPPAIHASGAVSSDLSSSSVHRSSSTLKSSLGAYARGQSEDSEGLVSDSSDINDQARADRRLDERPQEQDARAINSEPSQPARSSNNRPCKAKRNRYKLMISRLEAEVAADPVGFNINNYYVPPSIRESEVFFGKLQGRLARLQSQLIGEGGPAPRPQPAGHYDPAVGTRSAASAGRGAATSGPAGSVAIARRQLPGITMMSL